MNMTFIRVLMGMVLTFGLNTTLAFSERYSQEVTLRGTAETTKISGFAGETSLLGVPNSQQDDYAIYGFSSEEKGDNPCYVTVRSENINDSGKKLDLKKNFCGGKEKSREMKVEFKDSDYGKRTFVTGIKVCMNNKETRVKGFKIRGKAITENGALAALETSASGAHVGGIQRIVEKEPSDKRPNCDKDKWKKWAECPEGKIATAAVLHFEAGKEPRSLTGIALKCRSLSASRQGTGAVAP